MAWPRAIPSKKGVRVKWQDGPNKGKWRPGLYTWRVYWYADEKNPDGSRKTKSKKAGNDFQNALAICAKIVDGQIEAREGIVDHDRTIQSCFDEFLPFKIKATSAANGRYLESNLIRFLRTYGAKTWEEINTATLQKWYDQEILDFCVNGANFRLKALIIFTRWCKARNLIATDLTAGIQRAKSKPVARFLSSDEVALILTKGCQHNAPLREFITVILYTGMRLSQALYLTADRITDQGILMEKTSQTHSKTETRYFIPILNSVRPILARVKSGRLFTAWDSTSNLQRAWREAKRIAGITTRLRIHDLRHTAAAWLLKYGDLDLAELQVVLGHASIETTQIYKHYEEGHLQKKLSGTTFPIGNDAPQAFLRVVE